MIIDAALEPWILEVNMSPAMAHRTPEQSRLIASMSRGLLALAVFPHFPTLTVDDEDNDDDDGAAASGFHAPDCDSSDIGQPGAQAGAPRADYGEWEVLCAASSSTAAGCGTAETTGIEGNLLAVASDKEPEPQPEAAAAQAMEVTLGDWDEVEPPEVTARKATRRPSSALHRKYSGIGIGTGTGTDVCNNPAAPVCGNSQVTDPYFQKFVLAASAITAPGGTAVGAGNAVRMEGNALINPGGSFGNFMAVGVAISETAIATTDKLCDDFHKLLVLQQ